AAAVLAVGLFAVPIDLTVGAPARVVGEVQRVVPAPIRGYLKAVHVRPGDTVREGDLLAELGDRDLDLERSKLRSELAQHEGGVAAAMARGERAPMAMAQARVDEVRARLALVEHQLDRIRVRAPIDGIVLQGDLWQQVGAPLDRGRELFVLAPAQRHRVVVELDERDLRRIAEGGRGRLALSALPWETLPMSIERIAPAATTVDGRNVFELEARLDDGTATLRAGQRGVAHLDAGRGPLGIDWARRAGDAIARLVWRWLP
ncbi:MAG: HlyD family efflux transporter periplasmic adaptor subunit, partial [Burkholderiales bacterium]